MPKTVLALVGLLCLAAAAPAARAAPGRPALVYGPPPQYALSLGQYSRAPPPPPPPSYRPVTRTAPPAAPQLGYQFSLRAPHGMQLQPPVQRFRVEQQGLWRYTAPIRDAPLTEDQVPFQGLGASESVTMPEAPPFDPVLLRGSAAFHHVRTLSAREPHFFPDFPHTMLILHNNQQRLNNGLPAHRLGSIRPGSDFPRLD